MPIIRRRYHYGKLYMNPEVISGKGLCGQTVPVLSSDGGASNVHFAGFVNAEQVEDICRVSLASIEAYSSSDSFVGEWFEFGRTEALLGHQVGTSVYLVLVDGKPQSLGDFGTKETTQKNATVSNIGSASKN